MTLKTLKDIGGPHVRNVVQFEERLKQEDIKWVNFYLDKGMMEDFTAWRLFFNITEDDLK